jgi:PAS domain-containing protein
MDTAPFPDLQALLETLQSLDGFFDWDLVRSRIYFSPQWKRQLGRSPAEVQDEPDAWYQLIDPADRDTVRSPYRAPSGGASPPCSTWNSASSIRTGCQRWCF